MLNIVVSGANVVSVNNVSVNTGVSLTKTGLVTVISIVVNCLSSLTAVVIVVMKLLILMVVVRTSVVVSSVDMEVVSSSRNAKSITEASEVVCTIDGPGVDFATTGDTVTIISKLFMLDVVDVVFAAFLAACGAIEPL